MRPFFLAVGLGAICAAAYAGCGLTTEGELADTGPVGASSSSSTGMGDAGPGCVNRMDCPPDADCSTWTCTGGACVVKVSADGTPVATGSVVGDCLKKVCMGGDVATLPDDSDLAEDNDPCTVETCSAGVKQKGPAPDGTACGGTGKLACVNGLCEGCNQDPTNCDPPTDCQAVECKVNTCEYPILKDTLIDDSSNKDCKKIVCDAQGNHATVGDTDDVPDQTGDMCMVEVCASDGNIVQQPGNDGAKCADAVGDCELDSVCASGSCPKKYKMAGTKVSDNNQQGDCLAVLCDAAGGTMEGPDDTDVPMDSDPGDCSYPMCMNGVLNPDVLKNKGDACTDQQDGKCCGANCCGNASAGGGQFCDKNNVCCSSGKQCGGTCCPNAGDPCNGNTCCPASVCNNQCCMSQHACEPGSNNCCPMNQRCPNNTCCPSGKSCNGNNMCN